MPIPLAIPLILGGAGAISNIVGAGAQSQAARQITRLMGELPKPKMSEAAQRLAAESRLAAQENPLMAAMQRGVASQQATNLFAARQAARPDQFLQFVAGAGEQAQDTMLKAAMQGQSLQEGRRQAYYGALQGVQQAEQQLFENQLGNIQARANILAGAAGMRQAAAQGIGQGLMGAASSMFSSGLVGGAGRAAGAAGGAAAGGSGIDFASFMNSVRRR
jgi:hypothetical protein